MVVAGAPTAPFGAQLTHGPGDPLCAPVDAPGITGRAPFVPPSAVNCPSSGIGAVAFGTTGRRRRSGQTFRVVQQEGQVTADMPVPSLRPQGQRLVAPS